MTWLGFVRAPLRDPGHTGADELHRREIIPDWNGVAPRCNAAATARCRLWLRPGDVRPRTRLFETAAGHRIALAADGVAVPRASEPVADLFENVTLNTATEEYALVNTRQVWGVGTVDSATGKIHIIAYMQ